MPPPLVGWRVLELAEGTAAAFCGKVLSDLGAEVLMIEPPEGLRRRSDEPGGPRGRGSRFAYLSTGKHSMVVPHGTEGDGRLRNLAGGADVVVTDLDPARLHEIFGPEPDITVVCVRPFGMSGPRAGQVATHLTVFHAAGESSTLPSGLGWEMFPDRPPIPLGSESAYFDAGWSAAVAALGSLYDRLRGAAPQWVDVSIQESVLSLSRTRMNRWHNDRVLVGREASRYGIFGMLRCQDGWAQVVGMRDEHWDRLVERPEGTSLAEARASGPETLGKALVEWCLGRPKTEVVKILSEVGAPAGIFASPADLLASDQLAHRGFFVDLGVAGTLPGVPYRFSASAPEVKPAPVLGSHNGFVDRDRPVRPHSGGRFLEGVRIVDFTWAAAGPYATLLLGFLGAEVLKVESTRRPDPARFGFIARYDGINGSPIFNELNLNKRSLQVDLTQPEGLAILKSLIRNADVVIDNFRPGVMKRLGLGADDLLREHSDLVIVSSSANGSTGPDAMGAGLASIFAASGGLSEQTGYADGPPTEVGDPMDYRSGTALAAAVIGALLYRSQTGQGQFVDLSSREVVIASAPDALLAYIAGVERPIRIGNGDLRFSPHGVFASADERWLAVAICDDLQRSALQQVVVGDSIEAWVRERPADVAAATLQKSGIPAAVVATFADLAEDQHLAQRAAFLEVDHPELGLQRVMRAPWRFSSGLEEVRSPGPLIGADNETVLRGVAEAMRLSPERAEEVFR